jgi:hypothetical protein
MRLTSPAKSATATMLLVVLGNLIGMAPSAIAGEVHFDSQSPAGKEYALPLPQARSEALGTGAPADAPLFGVGIGGSKDAAEKKGDGSRGVTPTAVGGEGEGRKGRSRTPADRGNAAPSGGAPSSHDGGRPSRTVVISSASYGGRGAIALIAGLILAAVLGGFALRRSPRRRAGDLQ